MSDKKRKRSVQKNESSNTKIVAEEYVSSEHMHSAC